MRIVVLIGLPGSGKSTFLARLGAPALSSDAVRGLLADDENNQTIHDRVFATVRYLLRQRLALGRPVTYIDATNLTPQERRPYIEIGSEHGCEVDALFFEVPLEVCRQRNSLRTRVVSDEAMTKMAERLIPPSHDEGFSRVTLVSEESSPPQA